MSYLYLYDSFVTDKRHERTLARVETRLTDLGVSGRIERLTMFKDIREIVADAEARGCETVVAVGDDGTVGRTIDALGETRLSFGVIPFGEGSHEIAAMLGVLDPIEACNVLSRRVQHLVDLGRINDRYFLSSVRIPRTRATISCDARYKVVPTEENEIRVCNMATISTDEAGVATLASPRDGFLETVFTPAPSRNLFSRLFRPPQPPQPPTVVPVRKLSIRHQNPVTVLKDGLRLSSSVFEIEIVPKRLKVITGRDRKFE